MIKKAQINHKALLKIRKMMAVTIKSD